MHRGCERKLYGKIDVLAEEPPHYHPGTPAIFGSAGPRRHTKSSCAHAGVGGRLTPSNLNGRVASTTTIYISQRRSTPSAVYSTVSRWLATRAWSRFALQRSRYPWPELLHPSTRPPRVQGQNSHSPCAARYLPCLELSSRPSTWWLKMGHPRLWGGLRRAPEAMVSFQAAQAALWRA